MPSPAVTARSRAARVVLDREHVRRALRPTPADSTLAAAVRCAFAVGLALALVALTGHDELAGYASLAALASLYGRWEPYRRRGALLAVVGACFVAAIVVATLVAALHAPAAVTVLLAALVAAGTHVLCGALRTGPPGATIVVFGVGAGLAGSPTLADVGPRGLAAVVGAAVAWLVCCSGALVHPAGPARVAVRRASDATDRALATGAPQARERALALVERARDVLADDASRRRTRAATATLVAAVEDLEVALGGTPDALPARRTMRTTLRAARVPRGDTVRVLVAGLVAGGTAALGGSHHSPWAVMGSTAALQGATAGHVVTRGLQRAGGTALGALVAWPLLAADLPLAAAATVVVALQLVTEVLVMRHYGLAMLTITPMALLMTSLGTPSDATALALDRVGCSALGALVAVLALVVLPARHR